MALPHIQNSQAGMNKQEPLYKALFEVEFTLPAGLQQEFNAEVAVLTEQVQTVSGLNINKGVDRTTQKFMGTTRSYLNSKVDDTSFDITVVFALNLRNGVDNYVYKLFKAWKNLGYNLETGETALKKDYTADYMRIRVGNRAGDVYREILMKDIFVFGEITGLEEYDYSAGGDLQQLEVHFSSDWAQESTI